MVGKRTTVQAGGGDFEIEVDASGTIHGVRQKGVKKKLKCRMTVFGMICDTPGVPSPGAGGGVGPSIKSIPAEDSILFRFTRRHDNPNQFVVSAEILSSFSKGEEAAPKTAPVRSDIIDLEAIRSQSPRRGGIRKG